jgi:hypothetical protein
VLRMFVLQVQDLQVVMLVRLHGWSFFWRQQL